ncbi:MAG: DNA-processing protein DprA [Bacteroidales bacterium]|nr:DNA-processing protein DprA [Bacteroidales bacterium]MBP5517780.1 DNA-processing protein DprA [Bacteroidales bacterium]
MEEIETGMKEEALLCAMSRVLINHPASGRKLLEEAGSVKALLEGGSKLASAILGAEDAGEVLFSEEMLSWGKEEALWMRSKGVRLLDILSPDYPPKLRESPFAPFLLYWRGSADLGTDCRSVSVVGTRMASPYGRECCTAIVSGLAEKCPGVRIVSGLAVGIDGCAHLSAMDNSLETIAVLPCGIDMIYPSSHRDMAVRILGHGGILTEYPRGTKPVKYNFLQRNRIIAALSDATLVVESRIRGGSMSTVEFASSYNRDVFAVPGRMTDANSYGCNYLINKNVAQLCLNASTIISSMGWTDMHLSDIAAQPNLFSQAGTLKEKILLSLSSVRGKSLDALVAETGSDVQSVSLALLQMDLEGTARNNGSGLWLKKRQCSL